MKRVFLLTMCLWVSVLTSCERNVSTKPVNGNDSMRVYEKKIALTFDDGPGRYTGLLLDGLKERGVKASFFVIGENISGNEEIIKRMSEDGHLIGNHTYSHIKLNSIPKEKAYQEINHTNQLISDITGRNVNYIRPPYGLRNEDDSVYCNMAPVFWSVDTKDWENRNIDEIVKFVTENIKCGDIILMHDIYHTSVVAALRIIDELKVQGYVFVTVDELMDR